MDIANDEDMLRRLNPAGRFLNSMMRIETRGRRSAEPSPPWFARSSPRRAQITRS
ncbi:hypothetical protein [Methylobacterium sp. CM6247]